MFILNVIDFKNKIAGLEAVGVYHEDAIFLKRFYYRLFSKTKGKVINSLVWSKRRRMEEKKLGSAFVQKTFSLLRPFLRANEVKAKSWCGSAALRRN